MPKWRWVSFTKDRKNVIKKKPCPPHQCLLHAWGQLWKQQPPPFLLLEPSSSSLPITYLSSPHFPIHNTWKNSFLSSYFTLSLYWFPEATVTKHHELGGLQQHNFILLEFWRSEVQNQLCWLQVNGWTKAGPFGGSREESIFLLFQRFCGCQWSLVCHHSNLCFCSPSLVESPSAFVL